MGHQPHKVYLDQELVAIIGPVELIDVATGKQQPREGLAVTAILTDDPESEAPIDPALEVAAGGIGRGRYLARIDGSVLTSAAFGGLVDGAPRYLVAWDAERNFRVYVDLTILHPRRATVE